MKNLYDEDVWPNIDPDDLWVYDKLILSRKLGYICGPPPVPVPKPGIYVVRPITNLLGMSIGARFKWIERETFNIDPGYFWCEIFEGRHLTYDFINGEQSVCYEGFLEKNTLGKFLEWRKTDNKAIMPNFVIELSKKYNHINVECKENKIIEVHLRPNCDWLKYNAEILVPVWSGTKKPGPEYRYVEDTDHARKGFWIK